MHDFLHKCLVLVEATGLEPTTFWSLTKRATKLRYASICMRRITVSPAQQHKQLYTRKRF